MRNLKKVLALVIAFSMMLSVVAFAGYNDVAPDADYAGAVELLSALEIFEGDDKGNFNPDNTITRAEAAAVVCRALGLENSAEGAKGVTAFTDVKADHWATGYINLATQNGIINGHGDGTFGPEDAVTYEQIVKMIVCALGFEPMAALKGGYPTGYLVVANAYKVTAGVAASVEAPRKTVAQLLANALVTPKMDQTQYGVDAKWEVLDGKNDRDYATLLTDMDIYIASGIVGSKDLEDDTVAFSVQESSLDYEFGLKAYNDKKDGYAGLYSGDYDLEIAINGTDIANYETQYVDAYLQKTSKGKYKALAVVASEMGATLSIVSDDIKEINGNKVVYYVDGSKTKTIKVADPVIYSLNKGLDYKADFDIAKLDPETYPADVELKFIENTGDSEYDMILATQYANYIIGDVDVDGERIKIGKSWLDIEETKDTVEYVFYGADGKELALADFAEDDVVAIVANASSLKDADYIRIIKLTDNAVEGVVTEKSKQNGKNYVWIDGKKYETEIALNIEDEGIFYVGMTGKIFDFEGASVAGNYAYVLEAAKGQAMFSENTWEVKLLTVANGIQEYTFTEDADAEFAKYLKDNFSVTGDKWLFDDNAGVKHEARIITFKTNSKGEIKKFEIADSKSIGADKEYNARTQKIGGKIVDEAVLFNVNVNEADDAYATDVSYLVDEVVYEGLVVEVDKEVELFVITAGGDAIASDEVGIAIVTDIKETTVDGEDLVVVDYIQDMNEGTLTFDEESKIYADVKDAKYDYEDLDIGAAFVFNADANGYVTTYAVLGLAEGATFAYDKAAFACFSDENEFVYGYIASDKAVGSKGSKYTTFAVGGILAGDELYEISFNDDANTYCYYETKRDIEIKDDMFAGDANWYEEGSTLAKDEATFFFARIVDGSVTDIYTMGTRVVGIDNIIKEAGKAMYDGDEDLTDKYIVDLVEKKEKAEAEEEAEEE